MDNNSTTNTYAIESKDHLFQEMIALHGKIQKFLAGVSSKIEQQNNDLTKETSVKSGVLMTHEFKIREAIQWMKTMDAKEWIEYKADLQKDFKNALEALNTTIK